MSNQQSNKLEQKLDNSASFKKTFDSLLVKSQTPQVQQKQEMTQHNKKVAKKKVDKLDDQLNSWEFCNPENMKDELPQPYRFIDKCLSEMIMKPVYEKLFEIEKYKLDCNYEGSLKELPPQGSFEFDGITAMHKDEKNPFNHVLAGDKQGNLYLLDLNKKIQIAKKDISPGNMVVNIDSVTIPYGSEYLTTVALVARGDPKVYIMRYLSSDNRIFVNYEVILKQTENNATNYPQSIKISYFSEFIAISTYKGDVFLYSIPEPPEPIFETQQEDQPISLLQPPGNSQSPQITPKSKKMLQTINFDKKVEQIKEVFYPIEFKGHAKQLSYDDLVTKMKQQLQNEFKEQEQQPDAKQTKDSKKDAKKTTKVQQEDTNAQQQQNVQKDIKPEIEFNTTFSIDIFKQDSSKFPEMRFQPQMYFISDKMVIQNLQNFFGKINEVRLVTAIIVTWTNTNIVEIHTLQAFKSYNLQKYLFNQFFLQPAPPQMGESKSSSSLQKNQQTQQPPSKQSVDMQQMQQQLDQQQNPFQKKMVKTYQTIYPISCTCSNQSGSFLALGLKNGSILIWDINLMAEKMYLDKHKQEVTCMEFFDNWKLISGSMDGGVHIYNLQKKKLEMKRTNLFKQKQQYCIKGITISDSGLAFVLDSLSNLRLYDMYHYEKIARLVVSSQLDSKIQGWQVEPKVVMNAQKEQLCIVTLLKTRVEGEEQDQQKASSSPENQIEKDKEKEKQPIVLPQSNIQIIKIFDSLINLFPGLSNVFRKGVEKDKIANLFSKVAMKDLKDPSYEVPQIGPSPIQKQIIQVDQNSMTSSCRRSVQKSKASVVSQKQLSKTQSKNLEGDKIMNYNSQISQPQQQVYPIKQFEQSKSADSEGEMNNSFKTQKSISSQSKSKAKAKNAQSKQSLPLTKDVLHPEEYWFQKQTIQASDLNTNVKETILNARKIMEKSQTQSIALQQQLVQYGKELQIKEEKRILENRKKLMEGSKTQQKKQ